MTQEDKELLLKDLSARLPYRVKVEIEGYRVDTLKGIDGDIVFTENGINYPLWLVKLYLRPISSMTEEEGLEFYNLCKDFHDYELFPCYLDDNKGNLEKHLLWYTIKMDLFDWLNVHHFDYRGLIKKGLAIEVMEENNPYED